MKKVVILNSVSAITGSISGSFFKDKDIEPKVLIPTVVSSDDLKLVKKRGRKKKNKMYFTEKTEMAIVRYNNSENESEKNRIFNEEIYYPFNKLAENIINTFKFSYFNDTYEDVKAEVVSVLLMNIDKYKQDKGKAFSYFSIIAKNHLIKVNNENYSVMKVTRSIDTDETTDNCELDIMDKSHYENIKNEETDEFIDLMIKYWQDNLALIFKKDRDRSIAEAVVELFRRKDSIECFNKKALYVFIREITGYKTQYITKVLNKMQMYYNEILDMYLSKGKLEDDEFFYL
jgi:hypothetical protein